MFKWIVAGVLVIGVLNWQCAVRGGQLPGGPRDESPPVIDTTRSTPNFQTRFNEESIILTMDEWIELEDPTTQVLVSPPLERRPDIEVRGKAVLFTFHEEEVLREDATYTINFGEAIRDITESNPLKNYSFVFSTGDVIDSLEVEGMVIDAYTAEPVEDALIMVYEQDLDSIIVQEKPFYASRTLEDGTFHIGNMKEGAFQIVAITDANLNYLYDPPSESIAFLDTMYQLSGTSGDPVLMKMSQERELLYLSESDTSQWNKGVFRYNREPIDLIYSHDGADSSTYIDILSQQVSVWYNPRTSPVRLVFLTDTSTNVIDTLRLRSNLSEIPPDYRISKLPRIKNTGHPADPHYLCLDQPIVEFDTTHMLLMEGSDTIVPEVSISDTTAMCLRLDHRWQPDSTYQWILYPEALTSVSGVTNDTIRERVAIGNEERFGNIVLHIENLSAESGYLVELLIKDKPETTFYVENQTEVNRNLSKLNPGTYSLRITEDQNRNRRWDPASYFAKNQPEKTMLAEIEQLRANWDVEVSVTWNQE